MKKKGPVDGTEFTSVTVQMAWKNLIFINKQPHRSAGKHCSTTTLNYVLICKQNSKKNHIKEYAT